MKLPVLYEDIPPNHRKIVRAEYIRLQKGKCWYCGTLLSEDPHYSVNNKPINKKLFPTHFFTHPIHLQHDHVTGLTEGAVHAKCNAVLWQYEGR